MAEDNSIENIEYRDIPGFPGYRVGSDGSVWTCWKKVSLGGRRGTKSVIGNTWVQMLCLRPARCGHLRVNIKHRIYLIHRLVLMAFVGPCPDGMECCHNDGKPANNRLSNLRWDTRQSNMTDRVNHGVSTCGERQWMAKLTDNLVVQIRHEYSAGAAVPVIAKKYGFNQGTIRDAVHRKTWKHIK